MLYENISIKLRGASSVKYKLFDIDSKSVLAQGGAEKIGLEDSFLKLTLPNGEKVTLKTSMPEHHSAIQNILNVLTGKEYGCIESFDEIDAVGHRVVHGGEKFNKSVLINRRSHRKNKGMLRYSAVAQSCQHGGYRSNIQIDAYGSASRSIRYRHSTKPCPRMPTCMPLPLRFI